MILKEFEVLLHLLIIFNLAYVLTDGFTKILNDQISGAFEFVKEEIDSISNNLSVTRQTLFKVRSVKTDEIDSTQALQDAKEKFSTLETDFLTLAENSYGNIETVQITKAFRYLCLYSALYVLVLLIVAAITKEVNPHVLTDSLFVFNTISLFFIIYCVFIERDIISFLDLSFMRTIMFFCLNLSVSIVVFFILDQRNYHECWCGGLTISTWSIIIASLHFLVYGVVSLFNAQATARRVMRDITNFSASYEIYKNKELQRIIDWHKEYEKFKVQPK